MEPDLRYNPICSHWGKKVSPNRNLNRRIRDLGCFGNVVYVDFNYRQIDCPNCGHVIEKLESVAPYARVTTRLVEAIEIHNNTIGFVKGQARGFHDPEYFKLKIFQAINHKHPK